MGRDVDGVGEVARGWNVKGPVGGDVARGWAVKGSVCLNTLNQYKFNKSFREIQLQAELCKMH